MTTALYSKTTKTYFFFEESKAIKERTIAQKSHAFKGHMYTGNPEILSFFDVEL